MKLKYIIITIIILCIFAIIGNTNSNNTEKTEGKIMSVPKGIEVISHKKSGLMTIETVIKNNTGKELKEIKITAECYDKDNNNLGKESSGKYNVNTIDKHKINLYCNAKTTKYKLYIEYKE